MLVHVTYGSLRNCCVNHHTFRQSFPGFWDNEKRNVLFEELRVNKFKNNKVLMLNKGKNIRKNNIILKYNIQVII